MPLFLSQGVYRVGGVSVPRRIMAKEPECPEYSDKAIAAHIEGYVELSTTIGEDGVPRDMRVEKLLAATYEFQEKSGVPLCG
jgi:hypothetical protein